MTTDATHMTNEEFRGLYPDLAKMELVVLTEYDGDWIWQRRADGWHRLERDPLVYN
jgi:hypothetical protein